VSDSFDNRAVLVHIQAVISNRHDVFWKGFPGLVWSNSLASDSVMIMAALQRPRRPQLEAIAEEFGWDRVQAEWKLLQEEHLKPLHRALVDGMLAAI
jgi:hypothetical protein